MSDERLPTIGQMREQYAQGSRGSYGGSAEDGAYRRVAAQNTFDRWLAAHDAEVLATRKDSLTVRTVAELDALPDGAYILTAYTFDRDKGPLILRHGPDWGLTDKHDLYWWTTDGGDQISSLDRVDDTEHLVLPATVLWAPEETGR